MPQRPLPRNLRLVDDKPAPETAAPSTPALKPPGPRRAPRHLSPEARVVWRRSVRVMPAWHPAFSETLSMYCSMRAEYDKDPGGYSSTKLTTMRLLVRDLGLSPGTFAVTG